MVKSILGLRYDFRWKISIFKIFSKDQEKRRAAEKKAQKEAELKEMEMLFGKAITAKGNKFMVDPKAKKAEKKSKFSFV